MKLPFKTIIDLSSLTALASQGLVQMFDTDANVFCARLVRTPMGLVRQGHSPRYTIMTLLGLREGEKNGLQTSFDSQGIYRGFVSDNGWINGVGDLGLLLWLTSEFDPDNLNNLFEEFDLGLALDSFKDGRERSTTELSWFLAGLARAARTSIPTAIKLTDLAVKSFRLIKKNQGDSGFFGHLGIHNLKSGLLRGRIGNFADQIYPVYCFAEFAVAFHIAEALPPALKCARAICDAQGHLGQWWWLYDSMRGRIASRYPVYSVHQHAMAPMGLFALGRATGQDFQSSIHRGLRWIYGWNELDVDMRDLKDNVIWRCIRPCNKGTKYWEMATSFFGASKIRQQAWSLEVLYEDWPYELGWLLYAWANIPSTKEGITDSCIAQIT